MPLPMPQAVVNDQEQDALFQEFQQYLTAQASLTLPWVDLDVLCAPYIPLLRQVMLGNRFKATLQYGQARFLFFHGCLMGRIYYQGRCFAFPPVYRNQDGNLTWRLATPGDKFSQHEFFALPQDVLLFFFNLLKLTFLNEPIERPTQHPLISHLLSEVSWAVYP